MKKSVIVMIMIIYVASIVFIGFFGMKITAYDEIVYVNEIECINEDAKLKPDGTKTVIFHFDEHDADKNVYQILWKVLPMDATKRNVKFVYDEESYVARVDNFGRVFFKDYGTITVYLKSTDGSNIVETIKFIAI